MSKMKIKVKCATCGEIVTITADKATALLEAVTKCPCCASEDIKKINVEKKSAKEKDPIVLGYDEVVTKDEFGDESILYRIAMDRYDRVAYYYIAKQMQAYNVKYSVMHKGWITEDENEARKVVLLVNPNPSNEEREAIKESRKRD